MTEYPLVIDTLGKCIDKGYQIGLHCNQWRDGAPCNFFKWLDLDKLSGTLGRDHSCMHNELVPHLWCTRCGSRQVSLILSPIKTAGNV